MKNLLGRRQFIQMTSLLGMGFPFSKLHSDLWSEIQNSMYIDTIGLQLYTVREQLKKEPQKTFDSIKKLGYKQVEGMDATELDTFAPMIKQAGLSLHSSFFPWSYLTGRWDLIEDSPPANTSFEHVIEMATKHKLSHLVFGYLLPDERKTIEDYKKLIESLNKAGEQCKSAGIQLCYHNHSFEFEPVRGGIPFKVLMDTLDPAFVQFELDVFWASIGGWDPVKLILDLEGKVELLHLKDKMEGTPIMYDNSKVQPQAFKELGNGVVDIPGILEAAKKVGITYCMVEQDESPHPIKSIGESIAYLKKLK